MLYKSKPLTLVTMVYSWYVYEYFLWAQVAVFTHVMDYNETGLFLGRVLRTKETLPDFRE